MTRSDRDPRRPPTKADAPPAEATGSPPQGAPPTPPTARPVCLETPPVALDRPAVTPIPDPAAPESAIDAVPEIAAARGPFDSTDGSTAASAVSVDALDARVLPIVRALASVARETGSAAARLERALDLLFTACSGGDPELPALVLDAWQCARHDKQVRLRLAWQHEQLRLALQDILAEGAVRGELRPGIDAAAAAGVMVDAAEGCLLQSVTESGAIGAAELSRALLSLALRGA